jgi:dissimilatory sulfite reductase (desulfoviridin) alpha/beta subunit
MKRQLSAVMAKGTQAESMMLKMNACKGITDHCSKRLLPEADWFALLESWLNSANIRERLQQRAELSDEPVHKKLKIALSGCPNGCARHQVVDLGLVGMMTPRFNPQACTACGECAAKCPDEALHLLGDKLVPQPNKCQGCFTCSKICRQNAFEPSIRKTAVLVGGRLGRHPVWGKEIARTTTPDKALQVISDLFETFFITAEPGIRFGRWFQEQKKGGA